MRKNTAERLKQIMSESSLRKVDIIKKSVPFQKSLHVKLGKSALSQYFNGKQSPDQDKIYLLSRTLNVNEAWLIGFDVFPEREQSNAPSGNKNSNIYNFFDTGLSTGAFTEVNPFTTSDVKKIALPNAVMGKYSGKSNIIISRVNGKSMNRVLPNGSLIAIQYLISKMAI